MADAYDSATVQVIDREIEKLLNKSSTKKTRFSSFDDLFQNLEPQRPAAQSNNYHVKHEPVAQTYLEEGAVALGADSDDEEVLIANPILNPTLDQQIKQEYYEQDEEEQKYIIEGVFDQLYNAHIKFEEEPDPLPNHNVDEIIEQPEGLSTDDEYDEPVSDVILNENIPVESQENNITKDLASLNSQSNTDFLHDLNSHQITAQSAKAVLRSTPNNSNNNSMVVEEKSNQVLDPLVDEPLVDLNGGDDAENKPANESQEVYITGMNIKLPPAVKDLFNDDDDFQSPVKRTNNNKKQENKKSSKNKSPVVENNKVNGNHIEKKSKNNNKETTIAVKQKSTEVKASETKEKKTAENDKINKKNNNIVSKDKNEAEKPAQNGSATEETAQSTMSRSKRRVVLENMNKKYSEETKVVDGYFPTKQDANTSLTQNKSSHKKSKTESKIIQRWTLYCWGRKGFMHHIKFSVPVLKQQNLIKYYKTLLDEKRKRIQVDKIRSNPPSHIHVLLLDMSAVTYIINLGDKLSLNKQTAFVNKKGIQYKGRLYKSIEEWSSACLKETSSPKIDLATILSKIEVNNKGSLKQAMVKAKPSIQIMKSQPFLKRNVNRFVQVARKQSKNKTLFSNLRNIAWPPEEEPARYIYPEDYKARSDLDLPTKATPKKRKAPVFEAPNERPKKKLKVVADANNEETVNHSDPYLKRRNESSEPVFDEVKTKKAPEKKTKPKQKPIEEKVAQKPKKSPLNREKTVKSKEKPKEKSKETSKQTKEVRDKDRESPILERAQKPTKIRSEMRIEKPKPVISILKEHTKDPRTTNNKHTNGTTKEQESESRSSLRELVNAQYKKKKSIWLQNVKPVNNNNEPKDARAPVEIPPVDLRINLTASAEKQIVIEDDDLIYNEFFS